MHFTYDDLVFSLLPILLMSLLISISKIKHLKKNLAEHSNRLTSLNQRLQEQQMALVAAETRLEEHKNQQQTLKTAFHDIAQHTLDDKTAKMQQQHQSAIESLLKPFREQIQAFQQRVNDVHTESVRSHTTLNTEIKKIMEVGLQMSGDASNLTAALKGDQKRLGNWGEMQLLQALELAGLEINTHFIAQPHFKNEAGKSQYPDYLIKLPENKHLIIDSKVSLNSYDRAVSATSNDEKKLALNEHIKALKRHIDGLASKNYCQLYGINSPNFVLMFLPIEPAYIEALKHQNTLFDYAYQKNVVLVSHTTLMPVLTTVANIWIRERSHIEAQAISDKAGDIYNQVCLVTERLSKIGSSLNSLSQHYNHTLKAITGQQGLIGKIERFKKISTKATKTPAALEETEIEYS